MNDPEANITEEGGREPAPLVAVVMGSTSWELSCTCILPWCWAPAQRQCPRFWGAAVAPGLVSERRSPDEVSLRPLFL